MAFRAITLAAVLAVACGACAPAPAPEFDDADIAAAANFYRSLDASNAATRMINRFTATGDVPTDDDIVAIVIHVRIARDAAREVPADLLDRMHPDMTNVFRDGFEAGLAQMEDALLARDADVMAEGYARVESWLDWLEANAHDVRFPPRNVP